jgi:2-oxo-3-hexenedioate decarboxylase
VKELAAELLAAYSNGTTLSAPLSARPNFDMTAAYAVEAEFVRLRKKTGRTTVGLKVGYANKAMWRALKLETLVWAHMYDDTVHYAADKHFHLPLNRMVAPKIEPEIVFKMKTPLDGSTDPAATLGTVEWLALGFEIIDCPFPDWKFQPTDFVAAFGLHRSLIVGEPFRVTPDLIPSLVAQLPVFTLRLSKNGQLVEEGSGKNSLRSPALCLGELARGIHLSPGDLVSSGTLTTPTFIARGEEWKAEVAGLDVQSLTAVFE